MIRAKILSTWTKTADGFTPDAVKYLRPGDSLMDFTGEANVDRHTVNPVVVEMWICKETLAAIEKDYGADAILAYEPLDPEVDKNEGKKDAITKKKAEDKLAALVGKAVAVTVVDGTVCNVCEAIKAREPDKVIEKVKDAKVEK